MRRTMLWLLLLAAAAAARDVRLDDLFDPRSEHFPLEPYRWEQWEELPRETRQRARAIDPKEWTDPPPDPELEKDRKEAEEKRKAAGLPKRYPRDRFPGFHFQERLEKKQEALEKLLGAGSASVVEGLVKHLARLDRSRRRFDYELRKATEEYLQWKEQVDQATETFVRNYKKRHGKPPKQVALSASLLQTFRKASRRLQRLVALQQSERQFEEWLLGRVARAIRELGEEEREKPLGTLAKGMRDRDWSYRLRCAEILGRLGSPDAVAIFDEALREEEDPLVLGELVRIRAKRGGEGLMEVLEKRLDDPHWPVRVAVIRALARMRTKRAVDLLVARLAKEEGRLRDDIAEALRAITGQRFLAEPKPWEVWWKKARAAWKPPAGAVAQGEGEEGEPEKDVVYFYGIRTSSKRIVFCIDVSGSMEFPLDEKRGKEEPRIVKAKAELNQALTALPEDALFNIVIYNNQVRIWKKRMLEATIRNKKRAREFVEDLSPGGATNIYDALMTSLELAAREDRKSDDAPVADTIFFLTDGQPTHGRVVDPAQILAAVEKANRLLRVVIHTVGVSREQNAGFLLNLAKQNGGRYVAHK